MTIYCQFDVAMPRDPRMIAAGPLARLVYIEAVFYCRENLTDGVIDRIALNHWGVDIRGKAAVLDRLASLGALEVIANGWRIPHDVYTKWNPLRHEVEAKREQERARKAAYREKRHLDASRPVDVPTGQSRPATSPRKQPKPEPKPEPEPKPKEEPLTSTTSFTTEPAEPVDIEGWIERRRAR